MIVSNYVHAERSSGFSKCCFGWLLWHQFVSYINCIRLTVWPYQKLSFIYHYSTVYNKLFILKKENCKSKHLLVTTACTLHQQQASLINLIYTVNGLVILKFTTI